MYQLSHGPSKQLVVHQHMPTTFPVVVPPILRTTTTSLHAILRSSSTLYDFESAPDFDPVLLDLDDLADSVVGYLDGLLRRRIRVQVQQMANVAIRNTLRSCYYHCDYFHCLHSHLLLLLLLLHG